MYGIGRFQASRRFLIYVLSDPGLIGRGNYNRLAYTNSVSIAFGLNAMLYH